MVKSMLIKFFKKAVLFLILSIQISLVCHSDNYCICNYNFLSENNILSLWHTPPAACCFCVETTTFASVSITDEKINREKHKAKSYVPTDFVIADNIDVKNKLLLSNTCFDNTVFIGNSRTQGLKLYSSAKDIEVYAGTGTNLITFFTGKVVPYGQQTLSYSELMALNANFDKAIINFGINEVGWKTTDLFIEKYIGLIDFVKSLNPNADIYIQSIIPVEKYVSDNDKFFTVENIKLFNTEIKKMCDAKQLRFVDSYSIFADKKGNLPKKYSYDGIHLNNKGYEKWLAFIKMNLVS